MVHTLLPHLNVLHYAIAITTLFASTHSFFSPPSSIPRHHPIPIPSSLKAAPNEDNADDDINHFGYNVLGTELSCCCSNVGSSGIGTGFYRNGYCSTGDMDLGRHTVCVRVSSDFLTFSKSVGNDLSTPMPEYHFPGLKEGDVWCLCAQRWAQAYNAGKAPQLFLQATQEKTLDYIPLEVLTIFAIDGGEIKTVMDELNVQRSRLDELMGMGESEDTSSFQ